MHSTDPMSGIQIAQVFALKRFYTDPADKVFVNDPALPAHSRAGHFNALRPHGFFHVIFCWHFSYHCDRRGRFVVYYIIQHCAPGQARRERRLL